MKKENYFRSERWNAGIENHLQAALGKAYDTPAEIEAGKASGALQAVLEPVANLALTYYDKRIRAFFARAGVDIGDGVLTVDSIRQKVESATGLQITEVTAEALLRAFEEPLAKAVSNLLGFVVTKVFDQIELKRQVKEHVLQRLLDGEGGGIIKGRELHRLREAATWEKSGLSDADRRRILSRAYQRKYRKKHSQTWV